ncbi:MAG TPA: histidine kinase dimerization/phospho-acceptor domain-containing protein, partial [Pirellulales bacterium]
MCVFAAVAVVAVIGGGISVYEVNLAVRERREDELRRLQFNAERSAAQIGSQLLEDEAPVQLDSIRDALWLRQYWSRNLTRQPGRLYAAVVDRGGKVLAHTSAEREGEQVSAVAVVGRSPPILTRLRPLTDDVLTLGQDALDVSVPIRVGDQILGTYHSGLSVDWLDHELAAEGWSRARFWASVVGGMCGLVLLSSVAVVRVTRHTLQLEHEIEAANARRVTEMHELVLGIAHEIRNPLNAIRLNLHTVGQVFRDEAALGDEEIATMLDEMEREVARLETLMREMLGFARSSRKDTP